MAAVLEGVQQLAEDAAELAGSSLWPLSDDELSAVLRVTYHCEQMLAALQARVVHEAGTRNLPATRDHRTLAGWLHSQLPLDPQPAKDLIKRGAALSRQPALLDAVLDGRIDLNQAAAIAKTVDSVPEKLADLDDVGPAETAQLTQKALDTMIEMATRLPAYQLVEVGHRILAHVAPHLAERAEAAALARLERRAHQRRGFTMSRPSDGLVRLSGRLDLEAAAIVQAALDPLCKPSPGDNRTPEQTRADALVDICRQSLRAGEQPEPAQIVVTVGFDPLSQALGVGETDTGQRLSPEIVRRLACDGLILPAVLGGSGQVLDVGRARRLVTGALRRALHLRDRGCAFPDCDRPPRWCDAHHVLPWTEGGTTSLDNTVLLCRRHHRLIHHPGKDWRIRFGSDGRPEFIPPVTIDPAQAPRRNLHHAPP